VGEMLKQIDDKTERKLLRPNYPEIPWKSVFGMRNFISHEYSMVNPEKIFYTVKQDFPQLILVLHRIIDDLRSGHYDGGFTCCALKLSGIRRSLSLRNYHLATYYMN